MERRSVHHRPLPFTTDTSDQPVRPPQSAGVHHSSLRTVTSLVTSHPRNAASARKLQAGYRRCTGPASLCRRTVHAGEPSARPGRIIPRPASPKLWRTQT